MLQGVAGAGGAPDARCDEAGLGLGGRSALRRQGMHPMLRPMAQRPAAGVPRGRGGVASAWFVAARTLCTRAETRRPGTQNAHAAGVVTPLQAGMA